MPLVVNRYLVLCMLLGMMPACATQGRGAIPRPPSDSSTTRGHAMQGIAAWYGHPHHGRRAASGEIYDMHRLTAAHRTLPFHTIVRVQNKSNGRQVEVRINDRGPSDTRRVIDLSYAAAKALDMVRAGLAPVKLHLVRRADRFMAPVFSAQAGPEEDRDVRLESR